jgi:hypothetical protein
MWYVNALLAFGRFGEAYEQGRRALELDPLSIITYLVMGWTHFFEHRLDVAYESLGRALELNPAFFQAMAFRSLVLAHLGRLPEAAEQMEAAARAALHPPTALAFQAGVAALRGRLDECREFGARMIAMRDERYVSGFLIAMTFVSIGDLDAAESWVERAAEERSPWINYLKVDPRVAMLRDRPRIQAIVARLGKGA